MEILKRVRDIDYTLGDISPELLTYAESGGHKVFKILRKPGT